MNILTTIKKQLETVNPNVYYGSAGSVGADGKQLDKWNYIVFRRAKSTASSAKMTDYYTVAVVNEDYIAEDTAESVIKAMTAIPGIKMSNADITYGYEIKPSTNTVVEIMVLTFARGSLR